MFQAGDGGVGFWRVMGFGVQLFPAPPHLSPQKEIGRVFEMHSFLFPLMESLGGLRGNQDWQCLGK